MHEVFGLFILFIVGILLLAEGGHFPYLKLLVDEIILNSELTFCFVIANLVITDIVQSECQNKLLNKKEQNEVNNIII